MPLAASNSGHRGGEGRFRDESGWQNENDDKSTSTNNSNNNNKKKIGVAVSADRTNSKYEDEIDTSSSEIDLEKGEGVQKSENGEGGTADISSSTNTDNKDDDHAHHHRPTPLSMRHILPLLLLQYCEASGVTMVMPLMPRITEQFWGVQANDVGVVVGGLDTCYTMGKFFSSFMMGAVSDNIGRKKPIVFGIMVTIVGFSILTTVRSLPLGILLIFCISVLNGNLGLVKAAMADITDSSNRGVAFSYLG